MLSDTVKDALKNSKSCEKIQKVYDDTLEEYYNRKILMSFLVLIEEL